MDTATTRATISLGALRHNVSVVRAAVGEGVKICAVLKADAYGHGAGVLARDLAGMGARQRPLVDAVAVATFEEAEGLGRLSVPLVVLRPVEFFTAGHGKQIQNAIRMGWVLNVNSAMAAVEIGRIALGMRMPARVQIAVDTGMARAGAPAEEVAGIVEAVRGDGMLRLAGVCTHFVAGEEVGGEMVAEQMRVFEEATAGVGNVIRHAANSGAVFNHPGTHLDMVRPGKALYGIDPAGGAVTGRDLRPMMRWTASLLMVRDLKKGQTVGYGATYTAEREMRIGLLPVGFADGYMRCWSGKAVTLVKGKEAKVVGRVSMDYTTVDLTDIPGVGVGDEVTLLDSDPRSAASVYALAGLAGTIPSEVLCGIGRRVPRVVEGERVSVEVVRGKVGVRVRPVRVGG